MEDIEASESKKQGSRRAVECGACATTTLLFTECRPLWADDE